MSRRPPRKFPLLRLPRLALIEVVKCWNPIEIYLFSRVSRKTKEISKLVKIPDVTLGLTISKCYKVNLGNPARCVSTHWYFRLYPGLRNYEKYKDERYLDIYSKNSGKSAGKLIDHCQEIFKCEFGGMSVRNLKFEIIDPVMKSSNLKVFINWLNQHDKLSKIPYLSVSSKEEGNQLYSNWFMQNLKKDIEILNLYRSYRATEDSTLKVNGKVDQLEFNYGARFVDLDHLIRMDCVYMRGGETSLSNRDLNSFMKNWKEMKTNERVGSPWKKTQIFKANGGVDITRTDGKVATIGMTFHMMFEDEPLSREMIRDYQKIIVGQNMDGQEMDMNFVLDPEYEQLTSYLRKAFFVMVKETQWVHTGTSLSVNRTNRSQKTTTLTRKSTCSSGIEKAVNSVQPYGNNGEKFPEHREWKANKAHNQPDFWITPTPPMPSSPSSSPTSDPKE